MTDSFLDAVGLGRYVGFWTLNGLNSTATFQSSAMWGLVKVRGRFAHLEGEGKIGPDGLARGRLVLHAASVDTKRAKRDRRLRSVDFFSVDENPAIVFDLVSVEVTGLPGRVRIDGTFTIIGTSLPLVRAENSFPALEPTGAHRTNAIAGRVQRVEATPSRRYGPLETMSTLSHGSQLTRALPEVADSRGRSAVASPSR